MKRLIGLIAVVLALATASVAAAAAATTYTFHATADPTNSSYASGFTTPDHFNFAIGAGGLAPASVSHLWCFYSRGNKANLTDGGLISPNPDGSFSYSIDNATLFGTVPAPDASKKGQAECFLTDHTGVGGYDGSYVVGPDAGDLDVYGPLKL